ncbi:hypothetical protein AVEN_149166-1 [Araneus ventricosus]|uniref:Tc1-like transposase DDE domain-containing protein n=1 Tax=Araneus ventricosus TaxID=182803 RepID=A0A4Y2PLT8_ARAVE|nr:hypothetical protein AVEN_85141-1 [Araneus ventricosus]GBN52721.1 hypothetical protein AVEN_91355-1 [Araneus ventricosus]GBN52938.1 hypothetical protein AVEN_131829-1 [Araneus ventricosus]GBN52960.1 hypothetical protein AVEN_149166-1 [Araneus ventricosus]
MMDGRETDVEVSCISKLLRTYDSIAPEFSKQFLRQENASCHTSKSTHEWFKKENVNVFPCRIPDLNPMECGKAYANNKQFPSASELEVTIVEE